MTETMGEDTAATVIIGQQVKPGSEKQFAAWQHGVNRAAARYPGFLGAEVTPPTGRQPDWVVVYRFDSVANVQAWINSATRQDMLSEGHRYLAGPPTQQVVGGAAKPTDQLVTVVVSHRVPADRIDEFLDWQSRLRLAESAFSGYRGSELFRPVEGVQDEWTALYRYDTAADLDAWLVSEERKVLLAEGKAFHDFQLRTVDNSFGSWFAFDDRGQEAPPPSDFKTSVAVWVGLYPTVVLLTLALSPLRMPLWLGMLVGNLLSSFIMSFFTMPYYVNPLLRHWLRPPANVPEGRTNWRGFAIVVAAMAIWTAAIYLATTQFWHLP
jgi:antibiotic biosynthesis monooxygenase (ABM) superfamily enzyme